MAKFNPIYIHLLWTDVHCFPILEMPFFILKNISFNWRYFIYLSPIITEIGDDFGDNGH